MEYEYVALTWGTYNSEVDEEYVKAYDRLTGEGWETVQWATFELSHKGGACIMRRPKDEPRLWTKKEIEKIAKNIPYGDERAIAKELVAKGLLRDD